MIIDESENMIAGLMGGGKSKLVSRLAEKEIIYCQAINLAQLKLSCGDGS